MGDVQEGHGRGHQGRNIISDPEQGRSISRRIFAGKKKIHWFLVISSVLALIVGQAAAVLLGRYYFDKGGDSRWLSTLLQCVGWPILVIPLVLYQQKQSSKLTALTPKLVSIYIALGLLVAGDNLLYSWGVSFMPVSTYSLLCSSQLAFNAVFALILTGQRISPYILNSLVLLTFSAILLGVHSDSDRPAGVSSGQYIIGFICNVAASAIYGLILPLMQLVFKKVTKRETFTVVLEMQIYTSIVATVVCIMGLFISGESRQLKEEARNFTTGKRAYYMTLIWSAIGWQVCSVGVVGLIFLVSSLFSNVISTLSLPIVPILAVGFFHDKMNALKIMAMLLGIWGFVSYVFGGYVDSKSAMDSKNASREDQHISLAEG
eukprot:Gb_25279 [translate_table: standard]